MKKQKSEDRIHRRGAEGAEKETREKDKGTRLKEKSKKEKCLNKTWLFEPIKPLAYFACPVKCVTNLTGAVRNKFECFVKCLFIPILIVKGGDENEEDNNGSSCMYGCYFNCRVFCTY